MKNLDYKQKLIFSAENLFDINPLRKYELLFDNLDTSPLESLSRSEGRPSISKSALLRVLIYKNLKPFPTLYDLAVDLIDNPSICIKCGLPQSNNPQTHVERLSSFLKNTPNQILQTIRKNLVRELISSGEIKGKSLAIDSSAVFSQVKENNLNTSAPERFNKHRFPKSDPDSRLGVYLEFTEPFKKHIKYFWGYRNHVICDADSELPVTEITKPANIS